MDMDSVMDPTACIMVFVSCSNVFTDLWDNVDTFTIIYLCQLWFFWRTATIEVATRAKKFTYR